MSSTRNRFIAFATLVLVAALSACSQSALPLAGKVRAVNYVQTGSNSNLWSASVVKADGSVVVITADDYAFEFNGSVRVGDCVVVAGASNGGKVTARDFKSNTGQDDCFK